MNEYELFGINGKLVYACGYYVIVNLCRKMGIDT